MSLTLELVRFTVAPGREDEFLAGREAAVRGLAAMPGLVSATLAQADDGTWIDAVLWRSRPEAEAADRALRDGRLGEAVTAWASAIGSVTSMTHAQVRHRATGEDAGRTAEVP